MAPNQLNDTKTILELALELGVRSESIIQSMHKIGLEPDAGIDTQIESGLESRLIDQLITDGVTPASLKNGKGRRKLSPDEPLVDDELMKEALGASESGFQESYIPQNLLHAISKKPPGFLDKLLGRKKNSLAKSLQQEQLSDQELDTLFLDQSADDPTDTSPQYIEDHFDTELEDPLLNQTEEVSFSDHIELDQIDQDPIETFDELEAENELDLTSESLEETLEFDDYDDEPEHEPAEVEDLLSDDDFSAETFDSEFDEALGEDLELDGLEGFEDIENLDELAELDNTELEMLSPNDTHLFDDDDDREPGQTFLDRFFSKIQLTQTEMMAVMACSVMALLLVFGFVVYWWLTQSNQAQNSLLEQANHHFALAHDIKGEIHHGRTWSDARSAYRKAVDNYEKFIDRFPDHPSVKSVAFPRLCESIYQIATGDEQYRGINQAQEPYRRMSQLYEAYLDYLNNIAQRISQIANQEAGYLAYPDVEEQQQAMYRIAMAQRKLQNFDRAITRLEAFVDQFRDSPHALNAQVEIAKTYQDWAQINHENEMPLLQKAREAYEKSHQPHFVPEEDHVQRIDLNTGLGDIAYRLYEVANKQNKPESNSYLLEAIASYENAEQEYRSATQEPRNQIKIPIDTKVKIFQTLAELYMKRGREIAEKWREYETLALDFAEGISRREQLMNDANQSHQQAQNYFTHARDLYDELLDDRDQLDSNVLFELLYNTTESHHIMREYPLARSAGLDLLSTLEAIDPQANPQSSVNLQKAKTNYLLGHTAWEQARQDSLDNTPVDYTDVKKFYRTALELDPFYPTEDNGVISHLADIRLTNVYFLLDKNYDQAITNFERQVKNYPNTGYTYLTLNYYANALEEFGDLLIESIQAKQDQETQTNASPQLVQEIQSIKQRAKDLFNQAVTIYDRAIEAREKSTYVDVYNQTYLIDATFNKAHSAYKAGRYKDAEGFFTHAIAQFGNTSVGKHHIPPAIERLGDLHAKLGNYSQAVKHYRDYLNQAYEDSDARVTMKLGDAYLNQFSYDQARNQYDRIIKYYPPPSERRILQLQRLGGNLASDTPGFRAMNKRALSYYQQAATRSGDERVQFLNQALDAYEQLAQSYPNVQLENSTSPLPADVEAQRMIGNINFELGNYAQAAQSYESILQSQPNFPRQGQLYYRLGKAYIETQDYQQAIDSLKNINPSMMDNSIQFADAIIMQAQAYELLAEEYLANGDKLMHDDSLEKAIQTYDRVSETGVNEKIVDARIKSQAIQSVLEGEKATANQANQ